jgi:hypothetical protein
LLEATAKEDRHRQWQSPAAQTLGYDCERYWESLCTEALIWLSFVRKDWLAAHRKVVCDYPLEYRYGTVPAAVVRKYNPDFYDLQNTLTKPVAQSFVALVETGECQKRNEIPSMSANDYFAYCKVAYLAAKDPEDEIDESLSGRELYRQFADGRHEGLLEIEHDSPKAFADWIDLRHPLRTQGGHPWEIKRGGNTTHIDLAVFRPTPGATGFHVRIHAPAITRLAEGIQMFLALHQQGMPICITDPESIRRRILSLDSFGLVPSFASLHRANQRFHSDSHVYEVAHYADLGRNRRHIAPLITWEPLPLL